uniref:Uncharacterized protein n=1 Tax=viral metagenome TaxID=1070528 RepID=A0A6M3JKZ3_9ZZZZ
MKKFLRINVLMMAMVMLLLMYGAACEDYFLNSYKTLAISKQTYDTTLSVLGDLYKQGKLTVDQKDKSIELGRIYKEAHNVATLALFAYDASKNTTDKEAFEAAMSVAAKRLTEFLTFVQPLMKGGK